jgi:hypothetical protein
MKEIKAATGTKTMPQYIPTHMGSMMNFLINHTHHNEKTNEIKKFTNQNLLPIAADSKAQT